VSAADMLAAIPLLPYAEWDHKPVIVSAEGTRQTYTLTTPDELQTAVAYEPSAGELELADAQSLMVRGDYPGAIRKITTAIEVALEAALAAALTKTLSPTEVEDRLRKSANDVPGRLRQYCKLAARSLPVDLDHELKRTRGLRHEIVHAGRRLTFDEVGEAQRSVDTGRWIFNWFENQPDRMRRRETTLAKRSLGKMRQPLFPTRITHDGIEVLPINFVNPSQATLPPPGA